MNTPSLASPVQETRSAGRLQQSAIPIGRYTGILFGAATQLLFLFTVVYLFQFLRYRNEPIGSHWFVVDCLLSIAFTIPHSILLVPQVGSQLKKYMPASLLGCLHCATTCISLLVMFQFWQRSPSVIFQCEGIWESLILLGFYGSWIALFYSIYLTGLGYQTGLTQWWYYVKKAKPPQREFVVRGSYRWMRHPVYMSFLGLIWFTPVMTSDHLLLAIIWTAYVYAGSYFKDKRLLRFVGEPYREYARKTTGLPVIGIGSLRRWN